MSDQKQEGLLPKKWWSEGTCQKSIVATLHRSHMMITGLGVLLLVVMLGSILHIHFKSNNLINVGLPLTSYANETVQGTMDSLGQLRGWVLLGSEEFKAERRRVWEKEIWPSYRKLAALQSEVGDNEIQSKVDQLEALLYQLEEEQWWVEEVAQTPGDAPVRLKVQTELQPLMMDMIQAMTSMIELQKDKNPSQIQLQLLGGMADIRGYLGQANLLLSQLIQSPESTTEAAFQNTITVINDRLTQIAGHRPLDVLTEGQEELLDYLLSASVGFRTLSDEVVAMVKSGEDIVSLTWIRERVLPVADQTLALLDNISEFQNEAMMHEASDTIKLIVFSIFVGLVLILVMFLISATVSRKNSIRISRPLSMLTDAAQDVADGKMIEDLPVKSEDEIGQLTDYFNIMLSSLKASERLASQIIEEAPVGMLLVGQDGKIQQVNRKIEEFFGYERQELLGELVEILLPQELREGHVGMREGFMKNPSSRAMGGDRELAARHKKGHTFPVEVALNPIDTGYSMKVLGSLIDVTERRQAEEELRASAERLSLATHVSKIGVWDFNLEKGVLVWDNQMFEIYGVDPAQFSGTVDDWKNALHPDDLENETAKLQESIQEDVEFNTEFRIIIPKDQSIRYIKANGKALRDHSGKPTRMIGTNLDVTERRTAEEIIKQNAKDLEASNQELDNFAYIASHDLKEPLRGINNYALFLKEDYEDQLDEEGLDRIFKMQKLCTRMETLINSLLTYSRVGRVDMAIETTSLEEIVEDVIESLEVRLEELKVQVRRPRPLPTLLCDMVRVGEIFRNLITNAMKYNDKEEKWLEIGWIAPGEEAMPASNTSEHTLFYVRDNGIGIPEKHLDRIFSIFKRLHSREKYGGGSGAGLTIVKKIVERHNGEIWVDSTIGEGTTFYFTLGTS